MCTEVAMGAVDRPSWAVIMAGEALTEDDLTIKLPAGGLAPSMWTRVLGRKACRDYSRDEYIELGPQDASRSVCR